MAHGVTQMVFGLGTGAGTHGVNDQSNLVASVRIEDQIRTSIAGADIVMTSVCAGVDEVDSVSPNPELIGITSSDTILSVVVVKLYEDGTFQEVSSRASGDFVAGTDSITSTANLEDNQGNFYIVTWLNAA